MNGWQGPKCRQKQAIRHYIFMGREMTAIKRVVHSPYFLWALLALPSIQMALMLAGDGRGGRGPSAAHEIVEGSGVLATFLLLIALSFSPLQTIFPKSGIVAWLIQRRRYVGVAAFSYSVVHVVFYFVDLGNLREVLAEFATPSILTGWVALFILIPLAVTSNPVMTRVMGWQRWKMLQRGVYFAAVLVLAHWLIVEQEPGPLLFFAIVGLLECYRLWRTWTDTKPTDVFVDPAIA